MCTAEDRPLCTRLLEVGVAIESIEKGWHVHRAPELGFYLKLVLPPVAESLSGHAPLSNWISGPVRQLNQCLERQPETLHRGSQMCLLLKALKSGLLAASLEVKYNGFCNTKGLFAAIWEVDDIAQFDERSLLTRNSFLHYEANEGASQRSWSCPARRRRRGNKGDEVPSAGSKMESSVVGDPAPSAVRSQRLGPGQEDADLEEPELESGCRSKHKKQSLWPLAAGRWADQEDICVSDDDDDDDDNGERSTALFGSSQTEADGSSEKGPQTSSESDGNGKDFEEIFDSCPFMRNPSSGTTTTTASSGPAEPIQDNQESVAEKLRPLGQSALSGPAEIVEPGPVKTSSTSRRANRVVPSKRGDRRWWVQLPDFCPISSFPVSRLPYPPFRLHKRARFGSHEREGDNDVLVDGLILVLQVIKTMDFSVLEKKLSEGEIRALDYHIKQCKLGSFRLQDALKLQKGAESSEEMRQELEQMRARAGQRLDQLRTLQSRRKKREGIRRPSAS